MNTSFISALLHNLLEDGSFDCVCVCSVCVYVCSVRVCVRACVRVCVYMTIMTTWVRLIIVIEMCSITSSMNMCCLPW